MTTFEKILFRPSVSENVYGKPIGGIASTLFPGLVVHRSVNATAGWSVSHIATGFVLNNSYHHLCGILNGAIALAAICDWSQWKTEEEVREGATPHKEEIQSVFHEDVPKKNGGDK